MARILVAVDFSDASRQALDAAVALAKDLGASLVLVHAVQPPGLGGAAGPIGELQAEMGQVEAQQFLAEWVRPLRRKGVDVTSRIEEGRPADVVIAAAEEEDASLVVVGRQGWGRRRSLRLGSVSKRISQRCKRPVALVPFVD